MRRAVVVAFVAALVVPTVAGGHIERASYWPDPAPDSSIKPATGGKVPKARSLVSALKATASGTRPAGHTRVVCQHNSLSLLAKDIKRDRAHGYLVRPTDHRSLSAGQAAKISRVNQALFKRCRYHEIQPAVTDSGNNDRVVVMPGLYSEPTSRKQKTHDPKCASLTEQNDRQDPTSGSNQSGAVSYAYQMKCPNDQNLIAVMGHSLGKGTDPQPPSDDRHGIPNLGKCIRCNFQIEGSGVSADDVIVDAGRVASGNHAPIGAKKDVGIRADRADGFVLRNMTVRHANEHDIYILESDGYLLDHFKTFWGGEYGVLTFVEDHGLMENCEAMGNGDSGLYPGASADTGDQVVPPDHRRYSQEIRNCDSHHNAGGYSGTDGNAVHVDHNNFYDNALGFTTDVFTAAGHPGFPQDSDLIEDNNFYDNNFNPYAKGSDVVPDIPVPVGTGLWIAGGNHNQFRHNHVWDNYRRGTMLFAVPDMFVCAPPEHQAGCDPSKTSTSYNNSFYDNFMGTDPGGKTKPNGTDFWWDAYPNNTGNCWYGNHPASGRSITTSPSPLPDCNGGKDPSTSIGTSDPQNESELLGCLSAVEAGSPSPGTPGCTWFDTPSKPK